MNRQEMYEKVCRHLFVQGKQALGAGGECAYRGSDGTSCAAGCVIPDEYYRPEMEGKRIFSDSIQHLLPQDVLEHRNLLGELQFEHDAASNWRSTETMRSRLCDVGRSLGLDYAFLDDLSFKDR